MTFPESLFFTAPVPSSFKMAKFASFIGPSERGIVNLKKGGILHDIGKIGVYLSLYILEFLAILC